MIAAGIWPVTAIGVAAITGVYSVALLSYVIVDAFDGDVTPARIASHVPVLLGLVFALLVARERAGSRGRRTPDAHADVDLQPRPPGPQPVDDAGISGQSTGRLPTTSQRLRRAVVD
jgi:RNA polymerase sigma-70 factor, ECF subfamily